MQVQLNVKGMSQYSDSVKKNYQNSACGPTTIHVILKYLLQRQYNHEVNDLYKKLGCTKIGLFKWRLIKRLKKLLGSKWNVESCTLHEALRQLDEGRPVAMKFDKYFSLQWQEKPTFKYHWVPLIGYEKKDGELFLIVHDNGFRNRDSIIRSVRYLDNYKVLSFVKIEPK